MSAPEKTSGAGDEARVSSFREPAGVVPVPVGPPAPESHADPHDHSSRGEH